MVKGEKLMQATSRALAALLITLQAPSASVWRSTYSGLTHLFTRLEQEGEGDSLRPDMQGYLKALLFGPDPGTEALRLLRADALVAMAKASPTQASALQADVLALVKEERSNAVRDRLLPFGANA